MQGQLREFQGSADCMRKREESAAADSFIFLLYLGAEIWYTIRSYGRVGVLSAAGELARVLSVVREPVAGETARSERLEATKGNRKFEE